MKQVYRRRALVFSGIILSLLITLSVFSSSRIPSDAPEACISYSIKNEQHGEMLWEVISRHFASLIGIS
jgi:hypothetical protein